MFLQDAPPLAYSSRGCLCTASNAWPMYCRLTADGLKQLRHATSCHEYTYVLVYESNHNMCFRDPSKMPRPVKEP